MPVPSLPRLEGTTDNGAARRPAGTINGDDDKPSDGRDHLTEERSPHGRGTTSRTRDHLTREESPHGIGPHGRSGLRLPTRTHGHDPGRVHRPPPPGQPAPQAFVVPTRRRRVPHPPAPLLPGPEAGPLPPPGEVQRPGDEQSHDPIAIPPAISKPETMTTPAPATPAATLPMAHPTHPANVCPWSY
ncbi:hypothetical protein GCM10011428_39390 [Streptomyces violaceus]